MLGLFVPGRIFYGWWIVVAAAILAALGMGFIAFGFGVFLLPLSEEFNTTRGEISLVAGFAGLEGAMLGPIQGHFVDKYGPRSVMFIGVVLSSVGFLLLSFADTLWLVFVFWIGFIAVGNGMGFISPPLTAIARWFNRRRGIAFGLAGVGMSLGALFVRFVDELIEVTDWRVAARIIAAILLVIGIPLAAMMRSSPEAYGHRPDGDPGDPPSSARSEEVEAAEFTARQAMRTRAFWLMSLSFGFRNVLITTISVHFIAAMVDRGFTSSTAATLVGLVGIVAIGGRLTGGLLIDRFHNNRLVATIVGLMLAASMGILLWANELWQVVVFITVYAFSWGASGSAMFSIRAHYFGRKSFATISGIMITVQTIGGFAGTTYAGFVFDSRGSYDLVFGTFIILGLLAALLIYAARKPPLPNVKQSGGPGGRR